MESRRSTIFSDQYATGGALKSTIFQLFITFIFINTYQVTL
jgi:hypothetical protein